MSLQYNIKNDTNIKTHIYFKQAKDNNLDDITLLLENNDKFIIHNENTSNSYKNITDYIYRIIKNSKFLCKGLNDAYILDSFNTIDAIVIIGSSNNILPNGNIYGIALINFDEKYNSLYIDVICSHVGIKGAGHILMNEIEEICKTLFITKIYLRSIKSAFSFYEKYGFVKQDISCDDMCLMIKNINKNGGTNKKKKQSKQTKLRKIKKTRKTKKIRSSL